MGDDDTAEAPAAKMAARSLSVEMTVTGRRRAPDPHILEVRVHGISNTPPAQMLGLSADSITQSAGDTLGSFWTPKRESLDSLRASPVVIEGLHHKLPPDNVRLEAYSWGALARLSATSSWTFLPAAAHTVVRLLWVLLLPFGLTNVAYWSRALPDWGKGTDASDATTGRRSSARSNGSGALVRIFGLALTLLLTATTLVLTVDILARQCYLDPRDLSIDAEDGVRYAMVCSALPDFANGLARWPLGGRVALLAAVAMLAMLAIAGIGSTATTRFDRRTTALVAPRPVPTGAEGLRGWPWLCRPRFWAHEQDSWIGWRLHVGATFGLAALVLSVQTVYDRHRGDPAAPMPVGSAIAATLVLLAAIGMVARLPVRQVDVANDTERDRGRLRPWSHGVLGVSLAAFLTAIAAFEPAGPTEGTSRGGSFVVLNVGIPVLVAAMVLLPVAGLTARREVWWPLWAAPTSIALVSLGVRAAPVPSWAPGWWTAAAGVVALVAALLVLVVGVVVVIRPHRGREYEGWAGAGTAVFLALAAGIGLLFSTATVAAVTSWLRTSEAPENLPRVDEATSDALDAASAADPLRDAVVVFVPPTDVGFGGLTSPAFLDVVAVTGVVALAIFVVLVLLVVLVHLPARTGAEAPPLEPAEREPLSSAPHPEEERDLSKAEYTALSDDEKAEFRRAHPETYARQQRRRVRRRAALAHRAEPVVGILALLLWGAGAATFVIVPFGDDPQRTAAATGVTLSLVTVPAWLQHFGPLLVILAAAAVVSAIGVGGANGKEGRPWGLLWDLTCFLPRVAHPYAAPCYAERAVPELRGRIDEWLNVDAYHEARDALVSRSYTTDYARWTEDMKRRRVVVSAHSMGSVVSVAAIMARVQFEPLPDGRTRTKTYRATIDKPGTIALLTYGSQLRAYFGRFFPELFGPDVLGTRPARRAHLWSNDPWTDDRAQARAPGQGHGGITLVDVLRTEETAPSARISRPPQSGRFVRWRNLWRATDFIGFPVDSYDYGVEVSSTPRIDYGETEVDQTAYLLRIATHGGDYSTSQYREHLLCLIHSVDDEAAACPVRDCQHQADGPAPPLAVAVGSAVSTSVTVDVMTSEPAASPEPLRSETVPLRSAVEYALEGLRVQVHDEEP